MSEFGVDFVFVRVAGLQVVSDTALGELSGERLAGSEPVVAET